MSNVLPINQFKKFHANKKEFIDGLVEKHFHCINYPHDDPYTAIHPIKNNLLYGRYDPAKTTIYLELEYKKVLLLWYYSSTEPNNAEIQFATSWTYDEIEESDEPYVIPLDLDEGEFFQYSLINNNRFLTHELHKEIYYFVSDVIHEVEQIIHECYN